MSTKDKKNIGYYLLLGLANLFAMLPFWALYLVSDILYLLVYRMAKYRKKVVEKNLRNAFPTKTDAERRHIEKRFYRHLCDYFVETVKMLRISDKQIRKRMVFKNTELIDELTQDGKSCLLSLGHYGNWEWVTSFGMYLPPQIVGGQVYKTLTSKASDDLFLKIRSRFHTQCIEMKSIYRVMVKNRNEGKPMVVGFLSDQRPSSWQSEYWTTFLNQDTLMLTGMERIAQQMALSIVYLDIKKVKRGHYVGEFLLLTADASAEEKFTIIEKYARNLEKTVMNDPAFYLWSHNRWAFSKNNA